MSFPFNNKPMSEEGANKVYDVLVECCGADKSDDSRFSFVHEFTGEHPTHEYRFGGALGMGGKFRYPRLSVDCYPESRTPARDAMVDAANVKLSVLKTELGMGA